MAYTATYKINLLLVISDRDPPCYVAQVVDTSDDLPAWTSMQGAFTAAACGDLVKARMAALRAAQNWAMKSYGPLTPTHTP